MKKLIYSVFTLLALSLVIAGCSGDSYEKRLKKEKRAISNYIADNGIKVIYNYPDNHQFEKNEYYFDNATGVYWRVDYPGDDDSTPLAENDRIPVTIRFDSVSYMVKDTTYIGNNYMGQLAVTFEYGTPDTYVDNAGKSAINYEFMSPACILPLEKGPLEKRLRSNAIVDLIVPFINGSAYQRSYYEPMRFKGLIYTYYKQVGSETAAE